MKQREFNIFETLWILIAQEAELHTIASETVQGLTDGKRDETGLREGSKTFFVINPEVKLKDRERNIVKCVETIMESETARILTLEAF